MQDGSLVDLAPTILHLLGIVKPEEMTGQSLIQPAGTQPDCFIADRTETRSYDDQTGQVYADRFDKTAALKKAPLR